MPRRRRGFLRGCLGPPPEPGSVARLELGPDGGAADLVQSSTDEVRAVADDVVGSGEIGGPPQAGSGKVLISARRSTFSSKVLVTSSGMISEATESREVESMSSDRVRGSSSSLFGFLRGLNRFFPTVGFFDVMDQLSEGDVMMFRTRDLPSRVQRAFVRSGGFDHVGIIVKYEECSDQTCCPPSLKKARMGANVPAWHTLEADPNGVSLYRFTPTCLGAYHGKIAIRHLKLDPLLFGDERKKEMSEKLHEFVEEMQGRPYERSLLQMIRAANIFGSNEEEDLSSVFCSELVAAAYKIMGLIDSSVTRTSCSYIPGDFASRNSHTARGIKLVVGASLDIEKLIDCDNMRMREETISFGDAKKSESTSILHSINGSVGDLFGHESMSSSTTSSQPGSFTSVKTGPSSSLSKLSLTQNSQKRSSNEFTKMIVIERLEETKQPNASAHKAFVRQSSVRLRHEKPLYLSELTGKSTFQSLRNFDDEILEKFKRTSEKVEEGEGEEEEKSDTDGDDTETSAFVMSESFVMQPGDNFVQFVFAQHQANLNFNFLAKLPRGVLLEPTENLGSLLKFNVNGPLPDCNTENPIDLAREKREEIIDNFRVRNTPIFQVSAQKIGEVVLDTLRLEKEGWYILEWENTTEKKLTAKILCTMQKDNE